MNDLGFDVSAACEAIDSAMSQKRWNEAQPLIEGLLGSMPKGWSPLIETPKTIKGHFWDIEEFRVYSREFNALEKSIAWVSPSYSKLWWYLAVIKEKQKLYPKAVECILRGLRLEPDHPCLWIQLGLTLTSVRRLGLALLAFEKARSVRAWAPRSVKAWALRSQGYACVELRRLSEAKRAYQLSLELDPHSETATSELAYVEHLLNQSSVQ